MHLVAFSTAGQTLEGWTYGPRWWGLLNRGLQYRPAQRTCAVSPLMAVNARHIERRVQKNRGAEAVRMFRIQGRLQMITLKIHHVASGQAASTRCPHLLERGSTMRCSPTRSWWVELVTLLEHWH